MSARIWPLQLPYRHGRYSVLDYPLVSPIFRLISKFLFPRMISQGSLSPALRQDAVAPIMLTLFSGVARPQLRANHSQNHCSVPMTWTWLNKLQWQAQKYLSNQLGRNLGPKQETSHKGKQQSGDNFFGHKDRKLTVYTRGRIWWAWMEMSNSRTKQIKHRDTTSN